MPTKKSSTKPESLTTLETPEVESEESADSEGVKPKSLAARPEWEFSLPDEVPNDIELRELLQQMVFNNLVGPDNGAEEEVGETYVSEHYLCGMIAPRKRSFMKGSRGQELYGIDAEPPSIDEGADTLDSGSSPEDGPPEETPAHTQSMFPSAMGFTFTLPADEDVQTIRVTARFGHYTRQKSETGFLTKTGEPQMVWKRRPVETTHDLALTDLEAQNKDSRFYPDLEGAFKKEVYIKGRARKRGPEWIVTLFLVNEAVEPAQSADSAWLFQTHLHVCDPNNRAIFKQHQVLPDGEATDPQTRYERMQLLMAYRNCVEFGAGHNTSVHATRAEGNSKCAISIETRALPRFEVERQDPPPVESLPGLSGLNLSMEWLATSPQTEVIRSLRHLETAYSAWLDVQAGRVTTESDLKPFTDTATDNLTACARALKRIHEGITVLERDPKAFEAFRFANATMGAQRVRTLYGEVKRRDPSAKLGDFDRVQNRMWRPFQLAFILLNLPSLCDLSHSDRTSELEASGDLLWFPTGGGKTEAYLGLTAFTLAIRRLQGVINGRDGAFGVAVLMRYTLRLLTLQQFQRAAALICACEIERRKDSRKWGEEPFRLGLWVGAKTTPNSVNDADDAIKNARDTQGGPPRGGATPAQLTHCPWCAAKLDVTKDFRVDKEQLRTFIHCPNFAEKCPFTAKDSATKENPVGEGVPAIVVDEEIYRRLPSLLIATVDKFAQMPWNGRTAMLFGHVTGRCPRHGFISPEIEDAPSHGAKKQSARHQTT